MKPPPPFTIEDLQRLGKESRENIDRAMQEIATLEHLLKLIEQIPTDKKETTITLPVLTSMTKRLENLRKEGEGNDELHKRVEDAALKIFELCTSIPEVHDHLTSANMQEKLEYADEKIQLIDQAFGLIVLYPAQAVKAGIQTPEDRKALISVLSDPKIQSTICGRILTDKNPLRETGEHRLRTLRFLALVLQRQEKILREHPDKVLTTYSIKDWLLLIQPAVFIAYESSHRTLQQQDIKKTIQEILGKEKWVTDWDRLFLQEDLDRLKNVKPEFFAEAEALKKSVAEEIMSPTEEHGDKPESLTNLLGRLFHLLFSIVPTGYAVSSLRMLSYHRLWKEFTSLRDSVSSGSVDHVHVKKLSKKLKLQPGDIHAMLQSDEFMEKIARQAFVFYPGTLEHVFTEEIAGQALMGNPKNTLKHIFNTFKVYPFTIRYRGPYAEIPKIIHRFNTIVSLLRKFEYPRRPIEDVKDLAKEPMTYIVEYLSSPFVKVDPLTGKIDLGFGKPIVPIGPRRR